jgi:outer membrane protein assembly factor BamB
VQDSDDKETRICLEAGNRLFFADGAFLTAFETATGKVLWRLPSIGIRKLQVDAGGSLYVHSRNLPTEALSDADFEDLSGEIHPLTLKVDPESGKIDWQVEKYEDVWVSGKDIYALREGKRPEDIEEAVFNPGKVVERVKLYKLNRSTGEPTWEWFQPRRPRSVHADGKTVGLLFQEELQVLHSIAL